MVSTSRRECSKRCMARLRAQRRQQEEESRQERATQSKRARKSKARPTMLPQPRPKLSSSPPPPSSTAASTAEKPSKPSMPTPTVGPGMPKPTTTRVTRRDMAKLVPRFTTTIGLRPIALDWHELSILARLSALEVRLARLEEEVWSFRYQSTSPLARTFGPGEEREKSSADGSAVCIKAEPAE